MEATNSGNVEKRPQFGARYLTKNKDVFQHNSWDNVQWDIEQEEKAKQTINENSTVQMDITNKNELISNGNIYWDSFYSNHTNRFFKHRHWLFTEFPELVPAHKLKIDTPIRINETPIHVKNNSRAVFEIGCGVGNTIFPILQYSNDVNLYIYGCDYSRKAIQVLQGSKDYDENRCNVFPLDVTQLDWQVPFDTNSLDIVILIFVLSAIEPRNYKHILQQIYKYLKPGGLVLFRDYGRYDMVQLRFKNGKCLENNFYARGDGTLVYFFLQEEVKKIFEEAGFVEKQNLVDRRLQVNRGQQLKMYRVWIQAKYSKRCD